MSSTMVRIQQLYFPTQFRQIVCRYADTDSFLRGTK